MIDTGTPEGIPYDPESIELYEEFGDVHPSESVDDSTNMDEVDPITHLSWKELGVALGFGQEMIQGEIEDLKRNQRNRSNRLSAQDYKNMYINAKDKKGKKEKDKKQTNDHKHIGRDLREFERFVDGDLAIIARNVYEKESPFTKLERKLRVLEIDYEYLLSSLLQSRKAIKYKYLTRSLHDLNINICVDLCNLMDECINLDTKDIKYVVNNSIPSIGTPQVRSLIKELKMKRE